MEIVVCVHVIEQGSPGAEGLWRWAVHVGRDFSDQASCLNAGVAADQSTAEIDGQAVAVAAARVAALCGRLELTGEPTTVVLDHDPVLEPWGDVMSEDY